MAGCQYSSVILISVKTAISIPDDDYAVIERAVHTAGVSRSEFFRRGALRLAAELDDQRVTDAINEVVAAVGDEDEDTALVTAYSHRVLKDLSEW